MRIALFHATLPVEEQKPGGVEMHVRALARALAERGHDVTVLACAGDPPSAGVRVQRVGRPGMAATKLGRTVAVPLVLNGVDTDAFDVLHLHGDDWFFLRRRLPTVRTMHGSALDEMRTAATWRRRLYQGSVFPLEVLSARLATGAYGLTPFDRRSYRLRGTLEGGPSMAVGPASASTRSATPAVLFVGEWEGRKRGRFLYETFAREVRPQLPDAELWMVCDAPPHPGVRVLGRVSDEALAQLYGQAWVFCLPSRYEGLGLPYVEAMAAGTPVVGTPSPGSRHVLGDGRWGALATDDELGAVLLRLLSDDVERERLAAAGLQRAAHFDWDRVAARHEQAYEHAIAAFSRRR